MNEVKAKNVTDSQRNVENSVAIFAIPFILALGVAVFFVLMEILRRVL